MFGLDWILQMASGLLAGYLAKPTGMAKYAKYAIRIRSVLTLLFPPEIYPPNWEGTTINPAKPEKYAVPVEAIKPYYTKGSEGGLKDSFYREIVGEKAE